MPSYSGIWSPAAVYQAKGLDNWPYAPALAAGVAATFRTSAQLIRTNVAALTTTKAIISFHDYTNDGLYAVVATLSGTTISYGTPFLVKSTFSPYGSQIVALDATTALIVYEENANSYLAAKVLTISGTTITAGSQSTNSVVTTTPSLATLTSTSAICVAKHGGVANAFVISVSGTVPTFHTAYAATGGINATSSVTALSSTSAVMIRDNSSSSNNPTVNVMTISGTTVTMGANHVIDTDGISSSSSWSGLAALSSTSAIAVWKTAAASSRPRAVAMTIAGTTPTFGTVITLGSTELEASYNQPLAKVSETQAIYAFHNPTTTYGGAYVLTANGTTLYASLPQDTTGVINSGGTSIAQMDGKISLKSYRISTTSGVAKVITVT